MRNMVCFEHCAPRHLKPVAHTYRSSTSRCTCLTAVRRACPPTRHSSHLYADYIEGLHANYRKWYFAAQLDLDDAVGHTQNPGLQRLRSKRGSGCNHSEKTLTSALKHWHQAMNMSQYDRVRQIALYLLCWGESAQVRFVPECLCFIFKCANDYYRSPECQNRVDPVPVPLR